MVKLFAHHEVADWEVWLGAARKFAADTAGNAQRGMIEGTTKMYRTADGSAAIVVHTFKDLQSAQHHATMLASAEGQAMLENLGGKLPVTIWIAEEV